MGLTFVPLTLTAVHHLRNEDSGIGSGVLNTMQQVGGALGLATLARWRRMYDQRPRRPAGSAAEKAAALARSAHARPRTKLQAVQQVARTRCSPRARPPRSCWRRPDAGRLASSWIFLNVKHEELATDGPEAVVA